MTFYKMHHLHFQKSKTYRIINNASTSATFSITDKLGFSLNERNFMNISCRLGYIKKIAIMKATTKHFLYC